ncbi:MAG TPA: hypothetical protein VFV07_12650, partial [Rhizomicrobium sp.]|nr:hypothetical protein [Rhizomicrobium sp.]
EYDSGRGFPESSSNAVTYYRLSASQGNSGGQYAMCLMYYLGRGVPRDYVEAFKWCRLALSSAPAEFKSAKKFGLSRVSAKLSPAQIDEGLRRARAWRAVDLRKGKTMCADSACETLGAAFLTP